MKVSSLHLVSRRAKRSFFVLLDLSLVPFSLYASIVLRYGTATPAGHLSSSWVLFPLMLVFGAAIILCLRLDRIKLHAFETRAVARIGVAGISLTAIAIVIGYLFDLPGSISMPLLFGIIFCFLAVTARLVGLSLLRRLSKKGMDQTRVAIYGAGAAGIQLAVALRQAQEAQPVFFVDDNPSLQGLVISGINVYDPACMEERLRRHNIQQILLAVPSMSKARRFEIMEKLKNYSAKVKILPSFIELMAGNGLVESLRPVLPSQLLGRNSVALDTPEVAKSYAGKVIMVTGAGGSIGSELCRQLLHCNPAKIVFFESCELQLYNVEQELRDEANAQNISLEKRLGSVTNKLSITNVIAAEGVEIILHAAAYKHVPLVEENELEGARNNVLGTQIVAAAAAEAEIERFILISTDKAVRPTNVMGATKRMAELVVQDMQTRSTVTKFAKVRFGNVLGSSGSVLPLFQSQIARGGPITVTHKDVTRYFMTIPEAACLVLLAGAFAQGGDVFVLDMGEPQKIIDIAHKMVTLSGRTVKDPTTGKGDIAIEISGLRPGEKLHEELLIDAANLLPTPHGKIFRAQERKLSEIEVASMIREIHGSIEHGDSQRLRRLIKQRVESYQIQTVKDEVS